MYMAQVRQVILPVHLREEADSALEDQSMGEIVFEFEVLQVDSTGKALIWLHDPQGRPCQVAVCQLSLQTAFSILVGEGTALIRSVWQILGKDGGNYILAQWDPPLAENSALKT